MNESQIVAVTDLAADPRWPDFAPFVLPGFHAVAGVPVPWRGRNIGALNLYANDSRAWTTDDFSAARVPADLAATHLVIANQLSEAETLAAQLQHALDSRIVIEQAKGVIVARHGTTPDAASRSSAASRGRTV